MTSESNKPSEEGARVPREFWLACQRDKSLIVYEDDGSDSGGYLDFVKVIEKRYYDALQKELAREKKCHEDAAKHLDYLLNKRIAEVNALQAKVKRYEDALKFYADEDNYKCGSQSVVYCEGGDEARAALSADDGGGE